MCPKDVYIQVSKLSPELSPSLYKQAEAQECQPVLLFFLFLLNLYFPYLSAKKFSGLTKRVSTTLWIFIFFMNSNTFSLSLSFLLTLILIFS